MLNTLIKKYVNRVNHTDFFTDFNVVPQMFSCLAYEIIYLHFGLCSQYPVVPVNFNI